MPVVDAHNHFWHYQPEQYPWITEDLGLIKQDFLPQDLKTHLDAAGVEWTVAVEARTSLEENRFLLGLAEANPFIAGVVGWVDLLAADAEEQLRHFSGYSKFRGIRPRFSWESYEEQLLSSAFKQGVALLKKWGLTYDLLAVEWQLPATLKFVEQFPDQPFVLDHIAKPLIKEGKLEPWKTNIQALARHPQVYCKLSGLVTEADWGHWTPEDLTPYLEVVLEAFGPDRLMWGSDWPVCLLAAEYRKVREVVARYVEQLPAQQQQGIMGQNAVNFYSLS